MKRQIILGHFLTLLLGGLVYISFRQDTLKMFNWFDSINLSAVISELRLYTLPLSDYLPKWFLYSNRILVFENESSFCLALLFTENTLNPKPEDN